MSIGVPPDGIGGGGFGRMRGRKGQSIERGVD